MSKGYRNKAIGLRDMMDSLGLLSRMEYEDIRNAHRLYVENARGDRVLVEVDRRYTVYLYDRRGGQWVLPDAFTLATDATEEVKATLCSE